MDFNADDIRRVSKARRPDAIAEEQRRKQEERLKAEREELEGRALIERLRGEALQKRLDEVSHGIESAANAAKTTCDFYLNQNSLYGIHSLFGYKHTLPRRALLNSTDQEIYDYLKDKGFCVEIVNVNAQYENSHFYSMRVSW